MCSSESPYIPIYNCLCCETLMFAELWSFDICTVCGWQDDTGPDPSLDEISGANDCTLREARKKWQETHRRIR
jgi:hypothetical protein